MRAHLNRTITDNQGNVVAGCVIRILDPGTTTLSSATIWVDATTTTQLVPNPFTSANGVVDLYCDTSIRVRLGVTPPDGVEVFFEDLDFIEPVPPVGVVNSPTLEVSPTTPGTQTGLILTDSTGARWKITVDSTGHLVTTAL